MYNEFYGFSEDPFGLNPDSRFLYLTRSHREALASMTDAIKNRNGFISLTGDVGTGKTTLIYSLLDSLGEKVKSVHIFHTTLTFNELLKTILSELHLATKKGDTSDLLYQLNQYLIEMRLKDETLVIIIDEAQDLLPSVMKDLETLIPLGSEGMRIVLVGQPNLGDKLHSKYLKLLTQSIDIRRQIEGFSEEESAKYIDHRLRLVGRSSSEIFSPEAISLIYRYSQGIPRVINTLCDNALLMGFRSSQKKIDTDTIHVAIKNLEGPSPPKTILSPTALANRFHAFPFGLPFPSEKGLLFITLSLLCVGALVFLSYRYLQPKSAGLREIKSLKVPTVDIEPVSTSTSPQSPPPPEAVVPLGREYSVKKIVAAKKGQTISQLTQQYYGMVNLTLMDLLLELNPTITDVDRILVDQEIKIPNITEPLLIIPSPDHTYEIHVGTFENPDPAKLYNDERVLKGKKIEVLPRKVSPHETWHRVIIGKFDNKDEALKMIFLLKEKGLLPAFGGLSRTGERTHSFLRTRGQNGRGEPI